MIYYLYQKVTMRAHKPQQINIVLLIISWDLGCNSTDQQPLSHFLITLAEFFQGLTSFYLHLSFSSFVFCFLTTRTQTSQMSLGSCFINVCMMMGRRELELHKVYLGNLSFPKSQTSPYFPAVHVTAVSKSRFNQCFMSTNTIP